MYYLLKLAVAKRREQQHQWLMDILIFKQLLCGNSRWFTFQLRKYLSNHRSSFKYRSVTVMAA